MGDAQRRVREATYAAYFALQVHEQMRSGLGYADDDGLDGMAEDAATVADDAAARYRERGE